jgi:hypothetical protein
LAVDGVGGFVVPGRRLFVVLFVDDLHPSLLFVVTPLSLGAVFLSEGLALFLLSDVVALKVQDLLFEVVDFVHEFIVVDCGTLVLFIPSGDEISVLD